MLGTMDQLLARQHHPPAREIADRGFEESKAVEAKFDLVDRRRR